MIHDYTIIMSLMSAEAQTLEQRHAASSAFGDYALALKRCATLFEDPETTADQRTKAIAEVNSTWALYLHDSAVWQQSNIDIYHLKNGHPFREKLEKVFK